MNDDHMDVARIDGQSIAEFWEQADARIRRRRELIAKMESLTAKAEELGKKAEEVRV